MPLSFVSPLSRFAELFRTFLAVVSVLAFATRAMAFPNGWGTPVTLTVEWVIPDVVWNNFENKTIALVFVGPVYHEVGYDPASGGLVYDMSKVQQPTSPHISWQQPPVVMDVAQVNTDYFGANHKRSDAKIDFLLYPQNNSEGNPWLYADLKPSNQNKDIWDNYPNPNATNPKELDTLTIKQSPDKGTYLIPDISIWFTVFIIDDSFENGWVAYDMEFIFSASIQGNAITGKSVPKLEFRGDEYYKDLDDLPGVPEPSTLVLVGVGIVAVGLRRRRKPKA